MVKWCSLCQRVTDMANYHSTSNASCRSLCKMGPLGKAASCKSTNRKVDLKTQLSAGRRLVMAPDLHSALQGGWRTCSQFRDSHSNLKVTSWKPATAPGLTDNNLLWLSQTYMILGAFSLSKKLSKWLPTTELYTSREVYINQQKRAFWALTLSRECCICLNIKKKIEKCQMLKRCWLLK